MKRLNDEGRGGRRNKKKKKNHPYEKSNFLTRLTYSWITPYIFTNYFNFSSKKNKDKDSKGSFLTIDDVPDLPRQFQAMVIQEKYQMIYEKKRKRKRKRFLVKSLLEIYWKRIVFQQVLWMVRIVLMFLNPFIQQMILQNIFDDDESKSNNRLKSNLSSVLLCGLLALINFISIFIVKKHTEIGLNLKIEFFSCLAGILYDKILKIDSRKMNKRKESLLTFISVEIDKSCAFVQYIQGIWEAPTLLIISIVLMFANLGWLTLIILSSLIIIIPLTVINTIIITCLFDKLLKKFGLYVQYLSDDVLDKIKFIKFLNMQNYYVEKVINSFKKLLNKLIMYRIVSSISFFIPIIVISGFQVIIVVMTYFINNDSFNMWKIFPALMYTGFFSYSLIQLPENIQAALQARIIFKRMEKIMKLPECKKDNQKQQPNKEELDENSTIIEMKKAYFSWDKTKISDEKGKLVELKDISIIIKHKSLIGVTGDVGSGKTSLINAIIGEGMDKISGYRKVISKVLLCSQNAWIKYGTIKDNIVFGKDYNKNKLLKCIQACDLQKDIESFEQGINTVVIKDTVSTGQKNRIALARTLYDDADVYIIDDILFSVDTKVGKIIFEKAINGILRNSTRIIVTNNPLLLKKCDQVIVMKDMEIVKENNSREYINSFLRSNNTNNMLLINNPLDTGEEELESVKEKKEIDLAEKEHVEQGYIKFSTFFMFIKSMGCGNSCFGIILSLFLLGLCVITVVTFKFIDVWISFWTNRLFGLSNTTYLVVFSSILIIMPILAMFFLLFALLLTINSIVRIFKKAVYRVINSTVSFFHVSPKGRILNRFSEDLLQSLLLQIIFVIYMILEFIVSIVYIIITNIFTLIPIAIIFPLYYIFQEFYRSMNRKFVRLTKLSRSNIISFVEESISGIPCIRNHNAEKYFCGLNYEKIDDLLKIRFMNYSMKVWKTFRLELIGFGLVSISSIIIIALANNKSNVIIGGVNVLMGVSFSVFFEISRSLSNIIDMIIFTEESLISVERIGYYAEKLKIEATNIEFENNNMGEKWNCPSSICFNNVSMRYRKNLPLVLKNIQFTIEPGSFLGICGRTGSGKSSLIETLMQSCEIEKDSKILINDIDITKVPLKTLRDSISVAHYDATILKGSIRFNVDPKNKHTDEEVWNALGKCELKEVIKMMPSQLDEILSSKVSKLSIGQQRLLSLVRILLEDRKIVCLDEITSNLDDTTSSMIHGIVKKELKDTTLLLITHKINRIIKMDKILVLDNGKVKEFDTPENLMSNKNSLFNSFLKLS